MEWDGSKAVHLDLVLLCQTHFDEKIRYVVPLVSLKLDHFPVLRVVDDGPIASKLLEGWREREREISNIFAAAVAVGELEVRRLGMESLQSK